MVASKAGAVWLGAPCGGLPSGATWLSPGHLGGGLTQAAQVDRERSGVRASWYPPLPLPPFLPARPRDCHVAGLTAEPRACLSVMASRCLFSSEPVLLRSWSPVCRVIPTWRPGGLGAPVSLGSAVSSWRASPAPVGPRVGLGSPVVCASVSSVLEKHRTSLLSVAAAPFGDVTPDPQKLVRLS